jgi:hypothetical protein
MSNSTVNLVLKPIGEGGRLIDLPVDGGAHIYTGTMVSQLTATSMLVPGSTASSGPCVGVATHEVDNSAGSDGDKRCRVYTGKVFAMANGSTTDACSEATALFSRVYMADDHTVYDNDASGTLKPAGRFIGMEPDGTVRVFVGMSNLGDQLADASDVGILDAGSFTSTSDVEAALAEIYQHIKSTKAHVLFSLRDFREVTSGGDVGDTTANGGILASDTTPILRADANESEEISWAASNSDIVSVDISLPQDFDGTADATLDLFIASGSADAATCSILTSWDKGSQVTDTADDTATKSATLHTITATIAAADIPDSPTCVTIQIVPGAHTTNGIILGAVRLNYKRKLLTS